MNIFRKFSLVTVSFWLSLFAIVPLGLIIFVSFMSHGDVTLVSFPLTLSNFQNLADKIYLWVFAKSILIASLCTFLCLIIAYPFAYSLARSKNQYKNFLLILIIIPFWTSSLVRSYAMVALLKAKGILNSVLIYLGIIHEPLQLLFTNTAVIIGLVYNLLPFMILPLYANLEGLDKRLLEAASDLGASSWQRLTKIIIPLSLPGIISGCVLVFLPAMTLFFIPDLLGGAKSILLGNLIQMKFLSSHDWPLGAALSVCLIVFTMILFIFYKRAGDNENAL